MDGWHCPVFYFIFLKMVTLRWKGKAEGKIGGHIEKRRTGFVAAVLQNVTWMRSLTSLGDQAPPDASGSQHAAGFSLKMPRWLRHDCWCVWGGGVTCFAVFLSHTKHTFLWWSPSARWPHPSSPCSPSVSEPPGRQRMSLSSYTKKYI